MSPSPLFRLSSKPSLFRHPRLLLLLTAGMLLFPSPPTPHLISYIGKERKEGKSRRESRPQRKEEGDSGGEALLRDRFGDVGEVFVLAVGKEYEGNIGGKKEGRLRELQHRGKGRMSSWIKVENEP